MSFLYNPHSHYNLANLATFMNIIAGLLAIYFLTHSQFVGAALFAWVGGAFDILDGKIARKYNLSTEFGVQLDSFADFLSFVLVPVFFIYFGVIDGSELLLQTWFVFFALAYYVISGLRRLIVFNLKTDAGSLSKYFEGVPTPLGAIFLWIIYLAYHFEIITSQYIVLCLIIVVGFLLNSKIKIRHP
jgi:CDP-diacylglycerol--serine O-phosphatidyltransferase